MADIDIDIDTGTVTVPVDLGIWQDGQRLDLRLDEPTPVGMFLDDLVRLLGLPRRIWDGQLIDYWLHPRDEVARLDETVNLNEIEVPQNGLVLAASQSALDIRAELDRLAKSGPTWLLACSAGWCWRSRRPRLTRYGWSAATTVSGR